MPVDNPSTEHRRAWDHFQQVSVHSAAIEAFDLLQALPDAQQHLEAAMRLRRGFDPRLSTTSIEIRVEDVMRAIRHEASAAFQTIRSSALTAICASFEHLVKARYVDCALADQGAAAALLSSQRSPIKLDVSEVLGLPPYEQWFAIADEIFKRAGEGGRPMSDRVQHFLLDSLPMHEVERSQRVSELVEVFSSPSKSSFNLAFLYRNCLVHNGGRTSRILARVVGGAVGDEIRLDRDKINELAGAVRAVAESASPYWLLSLD